MSDSPRLSLLRLDRAAARSSPSARRRCRTAPDRRTELASPEPRFPLDVAFCPECSLVQILEEVPPEQLFVDNYLYFSSFSDHLLEHSRDARARA